MAGAGGFGRRPARPVDALAPRVVEQLAVERPEAQAVVEVAQVRELVAERVHQARVLERAPGQRVAQPDPDRAVGVADAVAPLHVGALGRDLLVPQAEAAGDALRIRIEPFHQAVRQSLVHAAGRVFGPTRIPSRSRA